MKNLIEKKQLLFLGLFLTAGMLFTACDDNGADTQVSDQEDVEIFADATLVNSMADEDLEIATMANTSGDVSGGRTTNPYLTCAEIIINHDSKTITIDFGDGCTGPYGRERSGKIHIQYGGEFNDALANRIISYENYYVNNRGITGRIELRDLNRNDDGNITATRRMIDFTVTFPDNNSFTLNGSTTREWVEGEGDGNPLTNVLVVTGAYEGTSTRGRTFSHVIVEPIVSRFSCRAEGGFLRVSGKTEMTLSNGADRSRVRMVNYGDGTCDNEIVISINGRSFTITEETV